MENGPHIFCPCGINRLFLYNSPSASCLFTWLASKWQLSYTVRIDSTNESTICKMTGDSWHLYQDDLVNNNAFAVRKRESDRASVRARAVPSIRKNEIPY